MRKQLLALLSALGLVGSATPGTTQVITGKDSSATKAETLQKQKKSDKAVLIGLSKASDAKQKKRKAGGEQHALDLEDKRKRTASENLSLQDSKQDKWRKVSSENEAARKQQTIMLTNGKANSVKTETLVKGEKTAANSSAAQSEAAKKANQATPK
jgi:hypothetical protein